MASSATVTLPWGERSPHAVMTAEIVSHAVLFVVMAATTTFSISLGRLSYTLVVVNEVVIVRAVYHSTTTHVITTLVTAGYHTSSLKRSSPQSGNTDGDAVMSSRSD